MWPALFGSTVIAALGVLLWTKAWRHWCQRAAAVVLPVTTTLPQETITLAFMALLGAVLSVLVIFLGVALIKTPRPRRRR